MKKTISLTFIFLAFSQLAFARYQNIQEFYNEVIRIARASIGSSSLPSVNGKRFSNDCIGFVKFVYFRAGIDLQKTYARGKRGVDSLYKGLQKYNFLYKDRDPLPGDLVFFDNTYDVNRNGIQDDPLSHIGIVESVGKYHTVHYIHFSNSGIKRSSMNLHYPKTYAFRTKGGKLYVINDFLRKRTNKSQPKSRYLSSAFFRSFAHIKVRFKK